MTVRRLLGALLLLVGIAVFLIRLQHDGPYGMPVGGPLLTGLLAIGLGGVLLAWSGGGPLAWLLLAASPVVLFLALYATLAELEEVAVLKARTQTGEPVDLRLWVVDFDGAEWVAMPRPKARAHALDEGRRAEWLRRGEVRCVVPVLLEERERVQRVSELRHEKYAIQRLATLTGIFSRTPPPGAIVLRLDPCPAEAG